MWWKIYFWVFTVLNSLGLLVIIATTKSWEFVNLLELISAVFLQLAIYAYVFRKKMFTRPFWQFVFWFTTIGYLLEILYRFTSFTLFSEYFMSKSSSTNELLFGIILLSPIIYAMYQLTLPSKKK